MSDGQRDRYFFVDDSVAIDAISGEKPIKLKYFVGGQWKISKTDTYMPCYNPSTGAVFALAPQCSTEEVEEAVQSAVEAFKTWSITPVSKRAQVMFKMKALLDKNLDELTVLLAREEGKKYQEAMGDILKVTEVVEFAAGAPHLMKGEALMQVSTGYDTSLYREPVGVFAGIPPWNFPAMIPHGWMTPICIVTGNCMVLKTASFVPQSAMRVMELWEEAGVPPGVINLVTAGRDQAELLLRHPDIKGISFVGSTKVGLHIYNTASANGKRVQALCEAKNHALVMRDCKLERTAAGIMNAFTGCAGARCMALPVIVVENAIADKLAALLKQYASEVTLGKAWKKDTGMGPVVNAGHREFVENWIKKGVDEGAELILDGRNPQPPEGCDNGFWVGPTILDHVTEDMEVGHEEVFGPVLCIKRVETFEEGLEVMNNSRFGNGSVIYTQNGYYARQFAHRTHAGMVGVNVGIPVPLGIFGFTGHKQSFFGDLHVMGKDGFAFFTESKCVTQTWFPESEPEGRVKVDTWDGTITSMPDEK